MNEQISLKFDILTNLSKSSLRDLEYEVAHARSYYLNQIKSLQTSIDESNVQALKDACTAINLNQNCNDISNSHEVMPEEIKVQSLFNTEDIQTELKKIETLKQRCEKLQLWLDKKKRNKII